MKPFVSKLRQWLGREGVSVAELAQRLRIPYTTVNDSATGKTKKTPMSLLAGIAMLSGYPIEYWRDDRAPWPPSPEYLRRDDEAQRLIMSLDVEAMEWVLGLLRDGGRRDRLRALERAADAVRPSVASPRDPGSRP